MYCINDFIHMRMIASSVHSCSVLLPPPREAELSGQVSGWLNPFISLGWRTTESSCCAKTAICDLWWHTNTKEAPSPSKSRLCFVISFLFRIQHWALTASSATVCLAHTWSCHQRVISADYDGWRAPVASKSFLHTIRWLRKSTQQVGPSRGPVCVTLTLTWGSGLGSTSQKVFKKISRAVEISR